MTDTNEGNVCRGCYDYCFKCSSRQHPKGMAAHEICNSCAENMNRCEACQNYIDEYDTVSCVECGVPYCDWCSDQPENMTRTDDEDPICRDCAPVKSAETFGAEKIHGDERLDRWVENNYGDEYDWAFLNEYGEYDEWDDAYDILEDFIVLDDDGNEHKGIAIIHRKEYDAETFESMSWYDPGEDTNNLERAFRREYPRYTLDSGSMEYLIYQGGASNKFHIFFVAQDDGGQYHAFNAYGRIGYNPRIQYIGGPYSTKASAEYAFGKKMGQKTKKGYRPFGAEGEELSKENYRNYGEIVGVTMLDEKAFQEKMAKMNKDAPCAKFPDSWIAKEPCDWKSMGEQKVLITRRIAPFRGYGNDGPWNYTQEEGLHDYSECTKCGVFIPMSLSELKEAEGSGDICTVCGDTAVHFYKDGEVILCDKHYQQQYGKYSRKNAEELSVKEPFQTGFKLTLGVISAGVVGTLGLGALGMILTGLRKGDE